MARRGSGSQAASSLLTALWALDALAAGWLLYLLLAFSRTGVGRVPLAVAWVGGLLMAAGWLVLWRRRRPSGETPPAFLAMAMVPAACLLVAALALVGRPPGNGLFHARFLGSRAALVEQADGVLIDPPPPGARWIGLFHVTTEARAGQVRFLTGDCAPDDPCGIVYAPGRIPVDPPGRYTRLGGPWYHLAPLR